MSLIEDGTALLLGSGISIFAPTSGGQGLPSGRKVVDGIIDRLFGRHTDKVFKDLIAETPFEQLLEHHPDPGRLADVFSDAFDTKAFNAVHEAIVREVARGRVEAIITTNYDRCLEGALEAANIAHTVIIGDDPSPVVGTPLFKVHGSAERPRSIVATLSKEFCLPDWKFDLVKDLTRDRRLVMLGFSGLDFDVCPAIFSSEMTPRLRIWNEPSPKPSVNYESATARGLAKGCALKFDQALGDPRLSGLATSQGDERTVIDALFANLDLGQMHRWRFRLLNALSHARYMRGVIEAARTDGSVGKDELLVWDSDLAEREGRYSASVELLKSAKRCAIRQGHRNQARTISTMIAGRLYTSHRMSRFAVAIGKLALIDLATKARLSPDSAYLLGLAAKGAHRKLGSRLTDFHLSIVVLIGRHLLRRAMWRSLSSGKWGPAYLCQVQLEDLGAPVDLRGIGRSQLVNLASDGFRHLNNFVGQISADRKHAPQKFADVDHLSKTVDQLKWLGLYPEIWKITAETYSPKWRDNVEASQKAIEEGLRYVSQAEIHPAFKREVQTRLNENLKALRTPP